MNETHECSWLCMPDANAHYYPEAPASETPGPGEGDLRGEVERLCAEVDGWHVYESRDCGDVFLADAVRDFIADIRAAVEQRTLAEQQVARVLALLDETEAPPTWTLVRVADVRAALADPEADR